VRHDGVEKLNFKQTDKMKKALLTLVLVALTAIATYAQGTIAFGNGTLTRVQVREQQLGPLRNATAADGLGFSVFFGAAGISDPAALTRVDQAAPIATIGPVDGIMINAPSIFPLPGTEPGQVVSLQILAWDIATGGQRLTGRTDIRQVTLAPTAGPGTVIWQGATGTNPSRFTPLVVGPIPEPSTIVLAMLGLGSLLLFRRRK
jgi:hypothetical protein